MQDEIDAWNDVITANIVNFHALSLSISTFMCFMIYIDTLLPRRRIIYEHVGAAELQLRDVIEGQNIQRDEPLQLRNS